MSPIEWRQYTIAMPKEIAAQLDAALSDQRQREDREITLDEFFGWLMMLGLEQRSLLAQAADQQARRIITP
jgi:hypothetical protein